MSSQRLQLVFASVLGIPSILYILHKPRVKNNILLFHTFLLNFSHVTTFFLSTNCKPEYHVSRTPSVRTTRSNNSFPVQFLCAKEIKRHRLTHQHRGVKGTLTDLKQIKQSSRQVFYEVYLDRKLQLCIQSSDTNVECLRHIHAPFGKIFTNRKCTTLS